jgi:uncharacterized integral membrane protein (TIGR00698 family)
MTRLLPGLAVAIAIAVVARGLATVLPSYLAEVSIAVLLGILVGQALGPRAAPLGPGLHLAVQRLLRIGIVLLGARLSLGEIARIGVPAALLVAATMAVSFGLVIAATRLVRVDGRLSILLAVGSAVCGNSAIVATAPVIGARPRDVAYAVATITLFGTLAVFVYPIVGRLLALDDGTFGLWSGLAINDTSQVVAAAAAFSPEALDVATVVKLIRNALMAPLLVGIAWAWARRAAEAEAAHAADAAAAGARAGGLATGEPARTETPAGLRGAIPMFVLGFLALAALRSVGVVGAEGAAFLDAVARIVILVALAAVGLSIRVAEVRETSWRPLAIGFAVAVAIGVAALVALTTLGLGPALGTGG